MLLLKNLVFTVLVPGTVAVYLPLQVIGGQPGTGSRWIGGIAFAVGAAIYTWCVWDFASFGRGTPAPIDAPRKLVVRGLYRYTRNPMYVGVLTVILGWAAWFGSPRLVLYAGVVGACFHAFIVGYEERHLASVFGDEYESFRSRVPRWLPRWPSDRASG